MKPIIPQATSFQGVPREVLGSNAIFTIKKSAHNLSCWKCDDAPCIKITSASTPDSMKLSGSNSPDINVCPSSALTRNTGGELKVVDSKCSGCGLCILNCPVNALVLDEHSLPVTIYLDMDRSNSEFNKKRDIRARQIARVPIQIDINLVLDAINAATALIGRDLDGKGLKIFTRNLFILNSYKSRIRIEGDTNDSFELVAEKNRISYPIEIAGAGDTLDSTRRIMSGCATLLAKKNFSIQELRPVLIVGEMPNSRSDIYRILDDMSKYLGLKLKMVPMSALVVLAYSNQKLEDYFAVDINVPAHEWFWRALEVISGCSAEDLQPLMLTK